MISVSVPDIYKSKWYTKDTAWKYADTIFSKHMYIIISEWIFVETSSIRKL
jgi:hypothetical protein